MSTVSLQDAQAHLGDLIDHLQPGEELIITRDGKPVARISGVATGLKAERQLGTMKGAVRFMAADCNAPLDYCEAIRLDS